MFDKFFFTPTGCNYLMIKYFLGLYLATFIVIIATPAIAIDPDAKSIPKPILMLGMYCNSSGIEMKNHYDINHMSLPWIAYGPKEKAFNSVFASLDFQGWGYTKSIKDKALTQNEIKFLVLTAKQETAVWLTAITNSCTKLHGTEDYESCLKGINTEVYKCYQQLIDKVNIIIQK